MKKIPLSKRLALMNRTLKSVRIYSFQHTDAWEQAKKRGFLTGDPAYVEDPEWPSWAQIYDWMRTQMQKRLPTYSGDYPVWAWPKRPNWRASLKTDGHTVLLTAKVPIERVLASDYDYWHVPLNLGVCTDNETDSDRWDELCNGRSFRKYADPEYLDLITPTWEKIFDLRTPTDPDTFAWRGSCDIVQLCVDRVYINEVVRVREWVGRKKSGF